jgi:hypothetical protein
MALGSTQPRAADGAGAGGDPRRYERRCLVGGVTHYDVLADAGRTASAPRGGDRLGRRRRDRSPSSGDVCLCCAGPRTARRQGSCALSPAPTRRQRSRPLVVADARSWTWEVRVASPAAADATRVWHQESDRRRHRHPGRGPFAGDRDAPPGAGRGLRASRCRRAPHWAPGHRGDTWRPTTNGRSRPPPRRRKCRRPRRRRYHATAANRSTGIPVFIRKRLK